MGAQFSEPREVALVGFQPHLLAIINLHLSGTANLHFLPLCFSLFWLACRITRALALFAKCKPCPAAGSKHALICLHRNDFGYGEDMHYNTYDEGGEYENGYYGELSTFLAPLGIALQSCGTSVAVACNCHLHPSC
jgi:hypothetical protein